LCLCGGVGRSKSGAPHWPISQTKNLLSHVVACSWTLLNGRNTTRFQRRWVMQILNNFSSAEPFEDFSEISEK
jgi:hypothetical protein